MEDQISTHEGQPAFPETDTQPESSPEQTTTETTETPTVEKEQGESSHVPFNEDPKIQEYIDRQVSNRLDKELTKFKPLEELAAKVTPQEDDIQVPAYWGGDIESYKQFRADQERLVTEAEERAIKRIRSEEEQQRSKIKEAQDWFESSVREIEATGETVDRNKLLKKAEDEGLVDPQGRWNYKVAWKLLKAEDTTTVDVSDRKKLSNASIQQSSKAEQKPRDYAIPSELKNVW